MALRGPVGGGGERIRVYLEQGPKWTFAAAIDWPGWSRRARGDDAAVAVLDEYRSRYERAVGERCAGLIDVVARVPGDASTDFGAPRAVGEWEYEPWGPGEPDRQIGLLARSWDYFDQVAATSPTELHKGPRGGGRDTAAIVDHVREAERAYAPKLGCRIPKGMAWPEQRRLIAEALRASGTGPSSWPPRYMVRRVTWHVLDHAWEIEDRRT